MVPSEFNYVLSGWLKSYRTSPYAGVIPNNKFYETYLSTIESLVVKGAVIHVAEVDGKLVGFICHSITDDGIAVIHYIYIKSGHPHQELIDKVLGKKSGFYTFKTSNISRLLPGWKFAPEIARRE